LGWIKLLPKPWTRKQEADLRKWVAEKKAPGVIAKAMGKTEDAVLRKIKRLGLEVVDAESCRNPATTSRLSLPKDLMSVEIKLYPQTQTSCLSYRIAFENQK
jgi:hypothetical protein